MNVRGKARIMYMGTVTRMAPYVTGLEKTLGFRAKKMAQIMRKPASTAIWRLIFLTKLTAFACDCVMPP
jgi:hypothetical protein